MAAMPMKTLQFVLAAHYTQEDLDTINGLLVEKFDEVEDREYALLRACSEVHAASIVGSERAKEHEPTISNIAERVLAMSKDENAPMPTPEEMFLFFDSMLSTAVKHWFNNNNTNPPRNTTLKA